MNEVRTIDNETLLAVICLLLSQGKRVKMRAKGNSMMPFIHGSEDILLLVPSERLRKGDVVLARIQGNRYVVHRIVEISDGRITLMGDGNLYEKEECSRSDVYGTVESVIRKERVHNISSHFAICRASAWRFLLPLRRLKVIIFNKINQK